MSSNLADQETKKRRSVTNDDIADRPTRRLLISRFWNPIDEEDTQILTSISGITPIPVKTTDLMIDADWFRRLHAWLDVKSKGKANGIVSMLSFLVIGGSASVLNLFVLVLFEFIDKKNHNLPAQALIYGMIATEISIVYNFYLNDRFTFRSLIDKNRTWLQRCVRFHGPAMVGFTLTQVLHLVFLNILPITVPHRSVIGQAIAIAIVTIVNFMMHRFWTYRPRAATQATI